MGQHKRHSVQLTQQASNQNDKVQMNQGQAGGVLAAAELVLPIWLRKGVPEESASPCPTHH